MASRLANVIYRVACIAAVLWVGFVLGTTSNLAHPDWTISTPIAAVGAVVVWGLGRAASYVLTKR
jgi:hypothetical protein